MKWEFKDKVTVKGFIFPDGTRGTLHGYYRGCPPDGFLFEKGFEEGWLEPVDVFTENGDYHVVYFDTRMKSRRKRPTLVIGWNAYQYKVLKCFTYHFKINPENGHSHGHPGYPD